MNAPPDFLTNAESNKWLLCQNQKCGFNFCQRCGASKGPIEAHGLYRHCFGCQFYKGLKEGVDNGPLRYWSAASTEVKRGRKKAGDVRCGDCCKMTRDTEVCPSPEGLPDCWSKDKDSDPKLWDSLARTMDKKQASDYINNNNGLTYLTNFGGRVSLEALSMVCALLNKGITIENINTL